MLLSALSLSVSLRPGDFMSTIKMDVRGYDFEFVDDLSASHMSPLFDSLECEIPCRPQNVAIASAKDACLKHSSMCVIICIFLIS